MNRGRRYVIPVIFLIPVCLFALAGHARVIDSNGSPLHSCDSDCRESVSDRVDVARTRAHADADCHSESDTNGIASAYFHPYTDSISDGHGHSYPDSDSTCHQYSEPHAATYHYTGVIGKPNAC